MENYEQLLEDAYKSIKPIESKIDRFELPKVEGHIEGTKTIITNFKQICGYVRRDCEHMLKFLLKELAAPGSMKGDRLVFTRNISSKMINEKIALYVQQYVICKECKKPDTELMKDGEFHFIHCLACGAKKAVPRV
jgi:translation initiation factor 2 subunit 2